MNKKSKFRGNMLRKLKLLALFCSFSVVIMAQTKTISGVVTSSEDKETLIGVAVMVKGGATGTVTDINGKYTISVSNNDAVLVFSMIGMKKEEVKVGTNPVLNVVLSPDSKFIDEVVVTGYSTQKKADLTGAVTVVDVNELKKTSANNPMQALQGRAAGVDITTDGSPSGSGTTVRIRGIGTLNNNDPLYVIDGVPTKSGMHELNSSDIESIQVLRDASAASIYGSRAGNGVIIITTKKGKSGKAKVNFDSYLSTSHYGKVIDMLNTKEFGQVQWQAMINSGVDPNTNQIGYMYDYSYDTNGKPILNGIKVPKYIDARDGTNTMLSSNTDWFGQLTRPGIAQSYNLSVSCGTDKSNSFFSLGYYNNQGTIKDTYFKRISARMNNSYKLLGDLITVGENFTINNTGELQAPDGVLQLAILSLPIMPVKKTNGDWGSVTSGMRDRDNPARILDANKDNPYNY
jgi:TonB-linked SusC/RagA family outer membrane protein